jgi:polyhydroxyalkanoate synthesis regulator phasin
MTKKNCNGWTNWETCIVKVWLGDMLAEMAEYGDEITAEYVQQLVDEMVSAATEEDANGLVTDLLYSAVLEINFDEIAKHYQFRMEA